MSKPTVEQIRLLPGENPRGLRRRHKGRSSDSPSVWAGDLPHLKTGDDWWFDDGSDTSARLDSMRIRIA